MKALQLGCFGNCHGLQVADLPYEMLCLHKVWERQVKQLFSHGRCAIETRVGLFPTSFFQSGYFHTMHHRNLLLQKFHLLSAMVSPLSGCLLKGEHHAQDLCTKIARKMALGLGFHSSKTFNAMQWATWLIKHCDSELAIPEIPTAAAFCYNWSGQASSVHT